MERTLRRSGWCLGVEGMCYVCGGVDEPMVGFHGLLARGEDDHQAISVHCTVGIG